MTAKEINQRLEKLSEQEFYLQMKDRWTTEDYETDQKINREIQKLEEQLKEGLKWKRFIQKLS